MDDTSFLNLLLVSYQDQIKTLSDKSKGKNDIILDLLQIIASNKLAIFPSNGNYVTKIIEEQKAFVESTAIESSDMNNNTETDNCNLDNLKDWQFPKIVLLMPLAETIEELVSFILEGVDLLDHTSYSFYALSITA